MVIELGKNNAQEGQRERPYKKDDSYWASPLEYPCLQSRKVLVSYSSPGSQSISSLDHPLTGCTAFGNSVCILGAQGFNLRTSPAVQHCLTLSGS